MSTGIEARHARSCASRNGGRCSCKPTWQAQVYDKAAGKRIRKSFPTITAARQWRTDARAAVRAGAMSADRGPTLKDATDAWLEGLRSGAISNRSGDRAKPATCRGYDRVLRLRVLPALGHLRIAEVSTRDVQRLVDSLVAEGLAPATIDTAVTALKSFYRRATARGDVPSNPCLGVEKPAVRCKVRRVVAPDVAERMIAALDSGDRALWATGFYTGLRRGELVGLRREDIDLATGLIHVRRGWDCIEGEIEPKSRQGRRRVPVPAALRDHLDQHLLAHEGGQVFGSLSSVRCVADRARKRWEERGPPALTLHAGSPHLLRASPSPQA